MVSFVAPIAGRPGSPGGRMVQVCMRSWWSLPALSGWAQIEVPSEATDQLHSAELQAFKASAIILIDWQAGTGCDLDDIDAWL